MLAVVSDRAGAMAFNVILVFTHRNSLSVNVATAHLRADKPTDKILLDLYIEYAMISKIVFTTLISGLATDSFY